MDIDPDTPLKYLSIGQWQMVEIAKALARNAKIIAFDEPTSSLSLPAKSTIFSALFVNCEKRGGGVISIRFSPYGRDICPQRCHHRL